jgi:protein-tyrosine phosphatase
MMESLQLCSALADDGVDVVVATPHQLGRYEARTPVHAVRTAVRNLNQKLGEAGIDLKVLPGGEVRLDERLVELLAGDEVLTLADRGRYVLLEFPPDVFIDISPLLAPLRSQGVDVVVAHPERITGLIERRRVLERWLDSGVSLQVTAGSLAGRLGSKAHSVAWYMVRSGWATIVATDAHDAERNGPCMTIAFQMLARTLGVDVAQRLCAENPLRILDGAEPEPVCSFQRQEVRRCL